MASSNGLEKQSEGEVGDGSIICKYGADSDKDIVWNVVSNGDEIIIMPVVGKCLHP